MHWDARHDSASFKFTRPFALTVIGNRLAFWNREQLGIDLEPGIDEVSLALVTDAWSRTYRSRAVTFARSAGAQQTRNGIRIFPDQVATSWPAEHRIPAIGGSATDKSIGPSSSPNRGPLRGPRRRAARIPVAIDIAMRMPR
jgi:hypothetical protein